MDNSKELKIEYDPKDLLGKGGSAFVFRGTFRKGKEDIPIPVAVKRIQFVPGHVSPIDVREEETLTRLDHENVVRLYHVENQENDKFRCYALELCDASLDKAFLSEDDPKKYRGPLPSPARVLLQLARGLDYIHSQKVIHRDIKPENVLISSSKRPVTMKWADFGLSKSVDSQGKHSISGFRGTLDWMAPEILDLPDNPKDSAGIRGTTASDVFPAGCLFFFYLTDGFHPFGSGTARLNNIQQGNAVNVDKIDRENFAYTVIRSMLTKEPEKRPAMRDVVEKLPKSDEDLERILREEFFKLMPSLKTAIGEAMMKRVRRLMSYEDFCANWKTSNGWTALHVLCQNYTQHNLVDIILLFVDEGVDVNCKDFRGWTALHYLCWRYTKNNLIDIVRLLVDQRVDVNCKEEDGWTPLHFLCRNYLHSNLIDIVRLLMDNGADVNCKTRDGYTVLHYLCLNYDHANLIDIVRLLVEKGVDVHYKEPDGWSTALHGLCQNYTHDNLIDIVRLLVDKGVDVNCKTQNGWTPLHILCREYNHSNLIDIVRLLVEKGVDVNCKEDNGWTALHHLCRNYKQSNLIHIVRLLVEKGVDVNCKTRDGYTALHFLCWNYTQENLIDIVRLLLVEKGADASAVTIRGYSALDFLRGSGKWNSEVGKLLRKKGAPTAQRLRCCALQ